MDKYQEALNEIKIMGDKDLYNERHVEWANILQEFIDQNKPLTFDECIKEWEERGWKVSKNTKHIVIKFTDNPTDGFIHISKRFEKTYIRCVLSYDLIHLLSKTLKALEVENDE